MKNRILFSITFCAAFLLFKNFPKHYFSSEPTCVNNPAFQGLEFNAETYQNKVISILSNKESKDFHYFFETFAQEDGQDYMIVNMRNNEMCFGTKMLVTKWDKLAGMRRTNGVSYPNELYDLTWKIENRNGKQEIIYQDMRSIID